MNHSMTATINKNGLELVLTLRMTEIFTSVYINNNKGVSEYEPREAGFSESEIKGLINIRLYESSNPKIESLRLKDKYLETHGDAKLKLERILYKKEANTLTNEEIYLLQIFRNSGDYFGLNKIKNEDMQFEYMFDKVYTLYSNREETLIFIADLIKNNIKNVTSIKLHSSHTINHNLNLLYRCHYNGGTIKIDIKKSIIVNNKQVDVSHISIKAFDIDHVLNKINEDIFVSGLINDKINIESAFAKKFVFRLKDDIIKQKFDLIRKAEEEILNKKANPLIDDELKILTKPLNITKDDDTPVPDYNFYKTILKSIDNKKFVSPVDNTTINEVSINDFYELLVTLAKTVNNI